MVLVGTLRVFALETSSMAGSVKKFSAAGIPPCPTRGPGSQEIPKRGPHPPPPARGFQIVVSGPDINPVSHAPRWSGIVLSHLWGDLPSPKASSHAKFHALASSLAESPARQDGHVFVQGPVAGLPSFDGRRWSTES